MRERGRKKGGRRDKWRENAVGNRMNLLHALLAWLLSIFTHCCHQARHPNWSPQERQTAAQEQTLSHMSPWEKKMPRCTVQQEAKMAAVKHTHWTPGSLSAPTSHWMKAHTDAWDMLQSHQFHYRLHYLHMIRILTLQLLWAHEYGQYVWRTELCSLHIRNPTVHLIWCSCLN